MTNEQRAREIIRELLGTDDVSDRELSYLTALLASVQAEARLEEAKWWVQSIAIECNGCGMTEGVEADRIAALEQAASVKGSLETKTSTATISSGMSEALATHDQKVREQAFEEAAAIADDEWKLDEHNDGHPEFFAKYRTVEVGDAIRALASRAEEKP